jgi:hypothetical protein
MVLSKKPRQFLLYLIVLLGCFGAFEGRTADLMVELKSRARDYYYGLGVPKDYNRALSLYLQAADRGDPEAQYIAGGMYFKGQGTAVDYKKAFEMLYTAAKNGKSTVESQKVIGQSFLLGRGVPKSYTDALRWYRMASENGDSDAQNELAFIYAVGNGVEQDHVKAYKLFEEAALGGLPMAQYNVGIMMYSGNGVPSADLPGAYAWFSLAASNGHEQAILAQQFLESILSREQVLQAQAKAKSLYDALHSSSGQR